MKVYTIVRVLRDLMMSSKFNAHPIVLLAVIKNPFVLITTHKEKYIILFNYHGKIFFYFIPSLSREYPKNVFYCYMYRSIIVNTHLTF